LLGRRGKEKGPELNLRTVQHWGEVEGKKMPLPASTSFSSREGKRRAGQVTALSVDVCYHSGRKEKRKEGKNGLGKLGGLALLSKKAKRSSAFWPPPSPLTLRRKKGKGHRRELGFAVMGGKRTIAGMSLIVVVKSNDGRSTHRSPAKSVGR